MASSQEWRRCIDADTCLLAFALCKDSVIRRLWLNAPFVMLGLWDERQEVRVPLFNNYREQAATPFVVFRATLQVDV